MIKVLHLQTHLPSSGNAAFRLHEALRQAGVDSSVLTLSSDMMQHEYTWQLGKISKATALVNNFIQSYLTRNANGRYGYFSYPIMGTDISKLEQVRQADIIYMHWAIGGFLSLANMQELAETGKPIIIFMHDMWPITGGCHHSFACEKYKVRCSNCQTVPSSRLKDLAASAFEQKLRFYSKYENLYFVSPSQWLYNLARQSALTKNKQVFHIPNILNTQVFKPIDKLAARLLLNIDPQDKVLCFGAASVDSPYKGWKYLQQALEVLYQKRGKDNTLILVFGSGNKQEMAASIPFRTKFLGRLRDDYSTALAYNAANVFVAPSLADNLPTTIMESLACGTAVVGFNTGGIPDMIKHQHNGYLAAYQNADDLANGIAHCLDNHVQGELLPAFDTEILVQKHFELYEHILTPVL